MVRILIEHGKHGETYHDVTTDHQLGMACLAILRERKEQEWYGDVGDAPTPPDFPEDSIDSLPTSMQEAAREKWHAYHRDASYHKQDNEFLERVNAILESKDPPAKLARAAYRMLCARGAAQYEGVSLEEPSDPAKLDASSVAAGHVYAPAGNYVVCSHTGAYKECITEGTLVGVRGRGEDTVVYWPPAGCESGNKAAWELTLKKSGIKTMKLTE